MHLSCMKSPFPVQSLHLCLNVIVQQIVLMSQCNINQLYFLVAGKIRSVGVLGPVVSTNNNFCLVIYYV